MSKYGIFLVRIFPHSVQIRENTNHKKLGIWTLFTQCRLWRELKTIINLCFAETREFIGLYFGGICGAKYSRMDQVKFKMIWSASGDHITFFKGCIPQILLGPFLNILSHVFGFLSAPLLWGKSILPLFNFSRNRNLNGKFTITFAITQEDEFSFFSMITFCRLTLDLFNELL